MTTGELIKKLRTERGWTQQELGKRLGLQKSAIAKYENGRVTNIKRITLQKLGEVFGVSPTVFLEIDNAELQPKLSYPKGIIDLQSVPTKRLPVIGNVACGEPILAVQEYENYIDVDSDIKADFALKAVGDSMIGARIHDGDWILCKSQEMVNNGEIAVVEINDEVTLKRFNYYKDKNLVILKPENPKYNDLVYVDDEIDQIRILGKAIKAIIDVK